MALSNIPFSSENNGSITVTTTERLLLFLIIVALPLSLSYFAEPDLFIYVAIIFPALYIVIHIGILFQDRKGAAIDLVWQEVAEHFQFRFTSQSHSERSIQGELEGSGFRIATRYERGGDQGGFDITTYSIQPKNIDNILTTGRRDLDHHAVNKKLNSESIKEALGRAKKTAGCTLRYGDDWIVWSELYIPKIEEILITRKDQMLDITNLLLEQDGASCIAVPLPNRI